MSRASGRSSDSTLATSTLSRERKASTRDLENAKASGYDHVNGDSVTYHDARVASPLDHGHGRKREVSSRHVDVVNGDLDDRISAGGDAGDLLNGVGSASSLASNVSSVFSNGGNAPPSTQHGAGTGSVALTPATNHESSPPERNGSPRLSKPITESKQSSENLTIMGSSTVRADRSPSRNSTPKPSDRQHIQLRPGPGEAKGIKATYDPELDPKLSAKDKRKMKVRYKKFGEEEHGCPPDPRLALAGYSSGNFNVRLSGEAKVWKARQRLAPYIIPPYSWDGTISIGAGPPTSVVVTGFDPFTPESQIRALLGSYGDISEVDNKTDPATGTFLGVCFIRYKDSRPGKSPFILAAQAALKAEKEGSGQRIGVKTVKVERDGSGRKCKRLVETLARRKREKQERERSQERVDKAQHTAPADSTHAAPPPNAPRGPSGKPIFTPFETPKPLPPRNTNHPLVEAEPILPTIKRKPYVFISKTSVPVMGTTIPHLKKRMRMYDWEQVRVDDTGYFIIFEDSRRGEEEAVRCFNGSHMQPLFTYTMNLECQQYGNPNYERSPSPERALAQKREREEQERIQLEEDMDLEEEKKQRALDLDPVNAALEQLRIELKDKVLNDIKTRIAAPELHDCLDPERHAAKRKKLGIPDPVEIKLRPSYLPIGEEQTPFTFRAAQGGTFRKSILSQNHSRSHKEPLPQANNAFMDERRRNIPKRKLDVRPLHQRLQDFYEEDSDDEHRTSVTHDTEEQDSRSMSRMSSMPPAHDHEDESAMTPRKRKRIERDETPQDEESGDEDIGIAKQLLDPHVLKKEPEDMAPSELQQIVASLPPTSKLFKRAKNEIRIRQKRKDDDRLFHVKVEESSESIPMDQKEPIEDIEVPDVVQTTEPTPIVKGKKVSKSKKKSKKQIFEEREAAKAEAISTKDLLQETATPEAPAVEEIHIEKPEEEEEEEEPRAEVNWAVSTAAPRRTVEDPEVVLDIDGWQELIKDEEDLRFLKEALANQPLAKLANVNLWAFRQKEIKSLNSGGASGVFRESPHIRGYFVPNITGCARTEGIGKILESEKSKYLPHRIKVAEARQRREAEAKNKTVVPVALEVSRQSKMSSTATSRSARANNRMVVKDINLLADGHGQQSDAIRFNQLKRRKKLLRFARSAIHGWGLYAEEDIEMGDMIIEYVGEKVRQMVANVRELRYDKQGMGSSYLFRIDEDTVVDATKKGGIARFINHSCTPNSMAKIIKVDGEKRIVIYALKSIAKNEEVVYDYKFAREEDPQDRVPCLCGSANCKGFLN